MAARPGVPTELLRAPPLIAEARRAMTEPRVSPDTRFGPIAEKDVQMLVAPLRATAVLAVAAALAACAPQQSADRVGANQAMVAQTVSFGTVTSARNVVVEGGGGSQLAGAVIGGVAGAALGNQVGGGTGQDIATVVGGTAGVVAGQQAGRAAASANAIEWTVRLENGQSVAVIQASPTFAIGQRVQVISGGGQTRLARPDPAGAGPVGPFHGPQPPYAGGGGRRCRLTASLPPPRRSPTSTG